MKKRAVIWFFLFSTLALSPIWAQVRLSEIMFNPAGSEFTNEFIEIFNTSQTDSVDLSGWRVGDEKSLDAIVTAGTGLRLPPRSFALILDPGYFGKSTQYDSLIPANTLIVTIGDQSFGSGGLSNSVAELVVLVNARGDTVDSYRYSTDNPNGFSDEKIDLFVKKNQGNWENSRVFNGTPGFWNSVSVRAADLALRNVAIDSALLFSEKRLRVTCTVVNVGLKTASNFFVTLYLDRNVDGRFDEETETVGQIAFGNALASGDSVNLSLPDLQVSPGFWSLLLRVDWRFDEKIENNARFFDVSVPFEPEALVLTEIMYRPEPGQPEWVELKNTTADTLLLFRWRFSDENTDRRVELFSKPMKLPPDSYVVVAEDSLPGAPNGLKNRTCVPAAWPVLNNAGDEIHLWEPTSREVVSVSYAAPEVPVGFSLEKVEFPLPGTAANRWLASKVKGGTPGRPNSVNPLQTDGAIFLATADSIFRAVFGQNAEAVFLLKNEGRRSISSASIRILENQTGGGSVLIQTQSVPEDLLPGDSAKIPVVFHNLPPGEHRFQAKWNVTGDENPANNTVRFVVRQGFPQGTVLLNEILYAPRPGWPEWVELANPGETSRDLTRWMLTDSRAVDGKGAFPAGTVIAPHDFLVVTGDSDFFAFYPEVRRQQVCVTSDFPHLGNTADSLFLTDLAAGVVDWLAYHSSWGGQNGHSLERIRPENPARDSTNWSTSVAALGSTPAQQNSLYFHAESGAGLLMISPDPFSPDGDGRDDFVTLTLHSPWPTAQANVRIFDPSGREVRRLAQNQPIGSRYEILWDGRDAQGRVLPVGLYIAFVEIFGNKMERKSTKKVFVLARRN